MMTPEPLTRLSSWPRGALGALAIGAATTLLSGCLACEDASRFEFDDGGQRDAGIDAPDASGDAGPDAGPDLPGDGGPDAALDAGPDAGPTPEICDGLDNDLDDLLDETCPEVVWEVAPRERHVCVRTNHGSVMCAGDGSRGLLGDGELHVRGGLQSITGDGPFVSLASGRRHVCAVHIDGRVFCWGEGNRGQNGSLVQRLEPGAVPSLRDAVSVTAGSTHTCALTANDEVFCWGANGARQLGSSESSSSAEPVEPSVSASRIVSGHNSSCAISAGDSSVQCWGGNGNGQALPGSTVNQPDPQTILVGGEPLVARAIASGAAHTCASRASDGQVFCWGHTPLGRLGGTGTQPVQTQVVDATHLVAGAEHTCAIRDAQVVCWGSNRQGQLGPDFGGASSANPITMRFDEVTSGATPVALFAGEASTCARFSDHTMYCWGSNSHGQLARNTTLVHPEPVMVREGATAVALGADFTCIAGDDSVVHCAGSNALGQLGDGLSTIGGSGAFVATALAQGQAIAAGPEHVCAALTGELDPTESIVRCWGSAADERLGEPGGSGVRAAPDRVAGLEGATGIAVGLRHGCMPRTDGALCFGDNADDQLGRGGAVGSAAPQAVIGPLASLSITEIGAGLGHTCALTEGSPAALYCWGRDVEGQIFGALNGGSVSMPVQLSRIGAAPVHLAVGANHNCVATAADSVVCWGSNERGQLGAAAGGTVVSYADATALSGPGANLVVGAGSHHTCVASDEMVRCWGAGGAGQTFVAQGADTAAPTDFAFPNASVVDALSLGQTHSCALVRMGGSPDAVLYCWGADLAGAMGMGRELSFPEPALVEMP